MPVKARALAVITAALGGLLLALDGTPALAQVTVSHAWVRATVPQQQASGAFMTITAAHGARVVGARSPAAASAEIHAMKMSGNMMSMSRVAALDLPAGTPVELAPGGDYHVMLLGLKHPLNAGDTVPLTLIVEEPGHAAREIEVSAPVLPLGSTGPGNR